MNLNNISEFVEYQKRIRKRSGFGLGCKLYRSGKCTTEFFCCNKDENGLCNYSRFDVVWKRMKGYDKIAEHYNLLEQKIDI